MKLLEITTIHRAKNGWLVSVPNSSYGKDTYVCLTWEEVEKKVKEAAFYFPHYTEPRMP